MLRNLYLGIVLGLGCSSTPFFSYLVYWLLENFIDKAFYWSIGMVCWFIFCILPYLIIKNYPLADVNKKNPSPVLYIAWFALSLKAAPIVVYIWPAFWLAAFWGTKLFIYAELIDADSSLSNTYPAEMKILNIKKLKLMLFCIISGVLARFTPLYEAFLVFIEEL